MIFPEKSAILSGRHVFYKQHPAAICSMDLEHLNCHSLTNRTKLIAENGVETTPHRVWRALIDSEQLIRAEQCRALPNADATVQ